MSAAYAMVIMETICNPASLNVLIRIGFTRRNSTHVFNQPVTIGMAEITYKGICGQITK